MEKIKNTVSSVIVIFVFASFAYSQSLQSVDLFESGTHGVAEFRIPSMITLENGTILAVCDARVDRPGDVPNNIDQVIRRSTDGGESWEAIRTIVDFANQEGAADPSLLQDVKTGRIFLFYTYCPGRNEIESGPNRNRRHLSLQYIYSDDNALSWSIPLVVEHGLKKEGWHSMWPAPGRGTQLVNGRLIVPITVSDTDNMHSYYVYSDDHGDSWGISENIGTGINEPTLVEIKETTLMVNARNNTGKRAIVFSRDQGKSCENIIYHKDLTEPGCQGSCIRIQDANGNDILLFSNPEHPEHRQNMTVKISYDNGKTWSHKKSVYEGPSAYSCLTLLPDGDLGLLYENGKNSPYEKISFIKFPLNWVRNNNN